MSDLQDAPKPSRVLQTVRWTLTAFIGCVLVLYLVSVLQALEDSVALVSHSWLWTADALFEHARYAVVPSLIVVSVYIFIRRNPGPNTTAPIPLGQLFSKMHRRLIVCSALMSTVFLVERIPHLRIQLALEQWDIAAWSLLGCLMIGPGIALGMLVIAWFVERHFYSVRDK